MAEELGQSQDVQSAQGVYETRTDAGEGRTGEVMMWMQAIELASKEESAWREKRAPETIDIYRDATDRKRKRYNILYANTEVMKQAVYNSRALPDVRARYQESDPIAQQVALVLERALEYACDDSEHDLDTTVRAAVTDVLLPGRCVDRVRYKPYTEKRNHRIALIPMPDGRMQRADSAEFLDPEDEWKTDANGPYVDGESYDQIVYEECYSEHVQWADFRRGPGKMWEEVSWIAFLHYMTRDQLKELNPKIGGSMQLDTTVASDSKSKTPDNGTAPAPEIFKRACVWEIWDKEKRQVLWIAPSYKEDYLRKDDDPLNLNQFFPIPRPVYAVEVPETLVPVEPYRLYKDQAEELDVITRRLTALTRTAKWRGFYAMPESGGELTNLQNADDGDLVPSQTAAAVLQGGSGDIGKYIWLMPIKECAEAINLLTQRQQVVKNNIYEIMGIADILRGGSQNGSDRQTAREASIKAQWGSIRIQRLQQDIQRYVRDIFRLMAEIIAEKYQPQTLQLITGIQIQPQAMQILRSDAMRCFRVDIETDSTIQSDLQRFQENAAQFIQGTATYFTAIGGAVKEGAIPAQAALDIFKGFSRMFKLPRQAQETIEKLQAPPPQQNPSEGAKQQAEIARAQADIQTAQIDGRNAQVKGAIDMQRARQDMDHARQEHVMEMQRMSLEHQVDMTKATAQLVAQATKAQAPAAGRA